MTKDRLNDLKKAQKKKNVSIDVKDDETEENSSDNNNLKKTFERAEVLGQWIEAIENNVQHVRELLKNSNDITFSQKETQDKLESLFNNTTSISHKIAGKLKEFDGELKKINTESAEGRIKTIQFNTLKTRFQEIFKQSNAELENYKNIQKRVLEAQIRAKGISITDDELTALIQDGTDIQIFTENIIAETAEAKRMLLDIEERHEQLLKIERMLMDVRDLFLQMSILVDNQQELINRVEYQAQQATDYVGAVDLKSVRKSKNKYMKRKIYFILILVVILIIILILIFK